MNRNEKGMEGREVQPWHRGQRGGGSQERDQMSLWEGYCGRRDRSGWRGAWRWKRGGVGRVGLCGRFGRRTSLWKGYPRAYRRPYGGKGTTRYRTPKWDEWKAFWVKRISNTTDQTEEEVLLLLEPLRSPPLFLATHDISLSLSLSLPLSSARKSRYSFHSFLFLLFSWIGINFFIFIVSSITLLTSLFYFLFTFTFG